MVIQCSHCQARFKLADDKIKPGGTKVRCAKCREIFTVTQDAGAAESPTQNIPEEPLNSQPAQSNEFSFDIGDIAAPSTAPAAPSLPQATNTLPNPAIAFDSSSIADTVARKEPSADGAAFSFDSSASEGDAFTFNEPAGVAISIQTEAASSAVTEFGDDSAFSFDESPSISLPIQAAPAPPALVPDAFGFGENNEEGALSFDTKAPPAPQTEAFSFDSAPEAAGFGEFSFDEKPPEATAQIDNFSFEQSGAGSEFSWDEAPATASLETSSSQTAVQQPQGAHQDFDFGNISFGDENPTPPMSPPPSATGPVPQKTPVTAEITTPAVTTAPRPQEASLPKRPQKSATNKPTRPRAKPKSSSSFGTIFKLLLIFLILGGGVFGYLYRDKMQTGYRDLISRFIEKQAPKEDQGQIDLINVYESVVENSKEGMLYVIRGEAVNGYHGLRSSILVKAVLHGTTGKILMEQSAYCGNVLNDEVLGKASLTDIKGFMANELGDSLTNLNIVAGKSVPFTIVFKADPKNIAKSTVEVVDSKPGIK